MSVSRLIQHTRVEAIVGDTLRVRRGRCSEAAYPCFGDFALILQPDGRPVLAQVVRLEGDSVSLQLFGGAVGVSSRAQVSFLGAPASVLYSRNILGRVFDGVGRPIDNGPLLTLEPRIEAAGAPVNPTRRALASRMIRTDSPMIDLFNTLVESQKIPIFSVAGQPYDALLGRIGVRTDADVVVFAGLGLSFDDYHVFRETFRNAGVESRTVMFVNSASDPTVERLLAPDLALAVAERFALEQKKRVLVLLTDMTRFADALKEVGIALERVPANRGYLGDLYSQLARRYERACDFKGGGSVTILAVTTMPGHDVTHPVPDNTGYITEGQIYLHDGVIDPFGSLSRLKQYVIGKTTREDHPQVMNAMIRLYAGAVDAEQKRAMAFDLSDYDHRLLRFGALFRRRFMAVEAQMSLEAGLDLAWATMGACFSPAEIQIKPALMAKHLPKSRAAA